MVEYRTLARPTTLKAIDLSEEDEAVLSTGVDAAVGLDIESPSQLDIRYRDGMTIVAPVNGPDDLKPWKFNGYVNPFDCRTWYLAKRNG